jgi:hypothetical protein
VLRYGGNEWGRQQQDASGALGLDIETLWAITAAVVPAVLTIGLGVMVLTGYQRGARLCFLFAGLWTGVIGFMWLIHTPAPLMYRVIAGVGIGVVVFVITPLLIRAAWPPDAQAQQMTAPPVVNQGPGSAFSYGQQGGVTAGTINVAPPRAAFTEDLGKQLLALMADEKKLVQLDTVGNTTDQSVGDDVEIFLKRNGFNQGDFNVDVTY